MNTNRILKKEKIPRTKIMFNIYFLNGFVDVAFYEICNNNNMEVRRIAGDF